MAGLQRLAQPVRRDPPPPGRGAARSRGPALGLGPRRVPRHRSARRRQEPLRGHRVCQHRSRPASCSRHRPQRQRPSHLRRAHPLGRHARLHPSRVQRRHRHNRPRRRHGQKGTRSTRRDPFESSCPSPTSETPSPRTGPSAPTAVFTRWPARCGPEHPPSQRKPQRGKSPTSTACPGGDRVQLHARRLTAASTYRQKPDPGHLARMSPLSPRSRSRFHCSPRTPREDDGPPFVT